MNLLKSWKQTIDNPKYVILSTISDLIFLLSMFYATYITWLTISEAMEKIQGILNLPEGQEAALQHLLAQQEMFMQNYQLMMKSIAVFVVIFFALWVVFQGFSWYNALKITKKKIKILDFYKKFALASAVMTISFVVVFYLTSKLAGYVVSSPFQLIPREKVYYLNPILFAVIVFFVVAYWANITKKLNFKKINYKKAIPGYLLVLAAYIILNLILMQIYGNLPMLFFYIIAIFVVIPLYTFLRVVLINIFSIEKN